MTEGTAMAPWIGPNDDEKRTDSLLVHPDDKPGRLELVSETQDCLLGAVVVADEDVLLIGIATAVCHTQNQQSSLKHHSTYTTTYGNVVGAY